MLLFSGPALGWVKAIGQRAPRRSNRLKNIERRKREHVVDHGRKGGRSVDVIEWKKNARSRNSIYGGQRRGKLHADGRVQWY